MGPCRKATDEGERESLKGCARGRASRRSTKGPQVGGDVRGAGRLSGTQRSLGSNTREKERKERPVQHRAEASRLLHR